jgi:hypothetical protein
VTFFAIVGLIALVLLLCVGAAVAAGVLEIEIE